MIVFNRQKFFHCVHQRTDDGTPPEFLLRMTFGTVGNSSLTSALLIYFEMVHFDIIQNILISERQSICITLCSGFGIQIDFLNIMC